MNTNTMELNMNEMKQVAGGDFCSTVAVSIVTEIERYKIDPRLNYDPNVIGGISGFCKGVWKGIFGGN